MTYIFQISVLVCAPNVLYIVMSFFVYPVSDVITISGCYILDAIGIFQIILFGSTSFYTALFRYLCMVHKNQLHYFGISAQVYPQPRTPDPGLPN